LRNHKEMQRVRKSTMVKKLKAHVTAVDYSELSVETAKEYNREMIAAGSAGSFIRYTG